MSKLLELNVIEGDFQQGGDRQEVGWWHLNQDLSHKKTGGKMFHREQLLSVKALRWAQGWSVLETERRPVCLESREQGKRGSSQCLMLTQCSRRQLWGCSGASGGSHWKLLIWGWTLSDLCFTPTTAAGLWNGLPEGKQGGKWRGSGCDPGGNGGGLNTSGQILNFSGGRTSILLIDWIWNENTKAPPMFLP